MPRPDFAAKTLKIIGVFLIVSGLWRLHSKSLRGAIGSASPAVKCPAQSSLEFLLGFQWD